MNGELALPPILYFSPMPPARSGIADYSQDLLPHLRERYRVQIADDESTPTPEGALCLYQMGNNVHHRAIYSRAVREPGLMVLHDYVLHHLLGETTLRDGDEEEYAFTLAYGHADLGAAIAHSRLQGVFNAHQQFVFPANAWILDRSLAAIVHSEDAARRVRAAHPDLPVHRVPMGVPLPDPVTEGVVRDARARRGIPEGAFVVANFGFVTPVKRVEALVAAFARLRSEVPGALLLLVGEVHQEVDVAGACRAKGIEGSVRITGYVPFQEWIDYLVASDLCVNLRYPTAGETSASLIRILGHGKPVLVSRYGQFRELPEGAVGFVDLGEAEGELLYRYLRELERRPDLRRRMGERARDYALSEHALPRATEGYASAIDATLAAREELGARVRARRPRTDVWVRTTRIPGVLRARVTTGSRIRALPAASAVDLPVTIQNQGDTLWLRNPGTMKRRVSGYVVLSARFFAQETEGERLLDEQWFDLPKDVPAGFSVRTSLPIRIPAQPGRVEMDLDLYLWGFGYFSDFGSSHCRIPVMVQ